MVNHSSQNIFKRYTALFLLLLPLAVSCGFASSPDTPVLARVELEKKMVHQLGVPVHAHLQGTDGSPYALVIATVQELQATGSPYSILHRADQLADGMKYLIAVERSHGARKTATQLVDVLHDDGRHIIVPATQKQSMHLAALGFEFAWMKETPMLFQSEQAQAARMKALAVPVTFNPDVQAMIDMATESKIYTYCGDLTGENVVTVGGQSTYIDSRYTYSYGIDVATQYTLEFFQAQGLTAQYHVWYDGNNVVGEKTGTTKPTELVLITAHLDAVAGCPGADDNASGSTAVMIAAEVMSQFEFERTVRFVLFTGEEQWLLGSAEYAYDCYYAGDNIVAVLNLDMIAWDSWGGPVLRLHTRASGSSGQLLDQDIADTFVDVVNTYGMSNQLTPMIEATGTGLSDQASFWDVGYPGILGIEDDYDDFNDYYHTAWDMLSTLNMTYFTNYVKAGVGTIAHLASPVSSTVLSARFDASPTQVVPGGTVQFTDRSTGSPTSWSWSFPGGSPSTSRAQNPVVTYNTLGTYDVTLTVSNAQGTQTATKPGYITVSTDPAPVPYCDSASTSSEYEWIEGVQIGSFNNTSGASMYTDFTNLTVNLNPGELVQVTLTPGFWSWSDPEYWTIWIDWNKNGDFTDQGEEMFSDWSETVLTGSFTVPAGASGTTRMRVSMSYDVPPASCGSIGYGEVEDYTVMLQGANQSPVANANGPYSGSVNTPVSFSSAGSSDPDGSIVSYLWDFGDRTSSSAANPRHTYTTAGTYTITLTVTDNQGATGTDSTTATITDGVNQPPVARANGPYSGAVNTAISFSSAGSSDPDGSIVSYLWDFGDQTSSSAANPRHTYTTAGTYTVTLTVTDNQNATGTDSTTATISDTPTPDSSCDGFCDDLAPRPSGCYCDEDCEDRNDCCPDFFDFC